MGDAFWKTGRQAGRKLGLKHGLGKAALTISAILGVGLLSSNCARNGGLDSDSFSGPPAGKYMVTAANPLAVEAGAAVLEAGGTAADAMIAVQLVLNLVEPQSSGIGGGAFALYYDGAAGQLTAYDGRETAPMEAGEDLFLDASGETVGFWDAVVGGRSVGTPGTVALMAEIHKRHGVAAWADLFKPAIELAENGFEVSPRLAGMLTGTGAERLATYATARDYFFPNGTPLAAGELLKNPDFGETLRAIAAGGQAAFYNGPIAADIVAAVRGASGNPGLLAAADMEAYRVIMRQPVCHSYHENTVCGMGPPSSGALTVGQILGMLEQFDLASMAPQSAEAWHLFAEASKLAYADRGRYMADSDYVSVPVEGLLDADYLRSRAALIDLQTAGETPVDAGHPPSKTALDFGDDVSRELPGTSHIAIVDGWGNAISMTTTIESAFGSQVMVRGFLLNNELTDFSFRAERDGAPVANRVEPGKRPRSSMAPTIVFGPDGGLKLAIGSPGGSRIIEYVAQSLVGILDWEMDIQAAISMGHVANRNGGTDLEEGTGAAGHAAELESLGHEVTIRPMTSGLHGILVTPSGLSGAADPRREGIVARN